MVHSVRATKEGVLEYVGELLDDGYDVGITKIPSGYQVRGYKEQVHHPAAHKREASPGVILDPVDRSTYCG
jgi:hypothetical protein